MQNTTPKRILLAVPGELRRAAIRAALSDSGFAIAAEGDSIRQALDVANRGTDSDLLLFEHDADGMASGFTINAGRVTNIRFERHD